MLDTSHTGSDLYHDVLKAQHGVKGANFDMTARPTAHALSDQPFASDATTNHMADNSDNTRDTAGQNARGSTADVIMNDSASSDGSLRMSHMHKYENGNASSHSGRTHNSNSDSSGSATPRPTLAPDLEIDDHESDSESVRSSSRIDVEQYYQRIAVEESEDASLYTYVPRRLQRRHEERAETDTM